MTRQERLKAEFYERLERQRESAPCAAEGGTPHHEDNDDDTAPTPPKRRWERMAGTSGFRQTSVSMTGTDPAIEFSSRSMAHANTAPSGYDKPSAISTGGSAVGRMTARRFRSTSGLIPSNVPSARSMRSCWKRSVTAPR
jgi:hypothetical protein